MTILGYKSRYKRDLHNLTLLYEETNTVAIKFGTDGWRAVIAETFTFENLSYTENRMKTELSGPHTKAFVGVYRLRQAQATLAELVEANCGTVGMQR